MDKLLNSSFYLHLEKGPELAKRYRILDILDGTVKYEKDGKCIDVESDELEIGVREITIRWLDKLYRVTKTQTKKKYLDSSYCYKGMKDTVTIKHNQIMLSLCGHVNDERIKKIFSKYSTEIFEYIDKKI